MATGKPLIFYLEEPLRSSAAAGQHNFINQMVTVVSRAGFTPRFDTLPISGVPTEGHSLSHMVEPPNKNGLLFRRVYQYPFWQIEAVAERWRWDVARAAFDPQDASADAARFYRFWQKRLFGDAPQTASREGFILVPLQGHLSRQRSFQTCSPLEMIKHCLVHNPGQSVIATLHPKESYSADDLAGLDALVREFPELTVTRGRMEAYLRTCDFVVTQNSGVAFSGFFFGKPALLFGKIDFHHITIRADPDALGESFARVRAHAPDYDKYIWWFWQDQSINAGRADAEQKIAARLARFGWPID